MYLHFDLPQLNVHLNSPMLKLEMTLFAARNCQPDDTNTQSSLIQQPKLHVEFEGPHTRVTNSKTLFKGHQREDTNEPVNSNGSWPVT